LHRSHLVVVVLLLVGVVPSCSSDPEIETVYDPCSPLTLAVAADLGAPETRGIADAIAAWGHVLPVTIELGTGAQAADVLPIVFEAGDTFYRAIYWDALGSISISRDRLAPEDYGLAIAHELGHAFGLGHVDLEDRPSIMNVGNLEVVPGEADAAAVRARWATCGDGAATE
jgi:hypothetical protein